MSAVPLIIPPPIQNYMKRVIQGNLYLVLRTTRDEPGLSLKEIAETMKKVFDEVEIKSIIKELKNEKEN